MKAEKIDQPVDPALAGQQEAAKQQTINQLQQQAEGDTAAFMARYGTRLALSGVGPLSSGSGLPVPGKL